ncbi:MAG: hypothetical protein AAF488_13445 [Planctomycetota bacterium]
MTDRHAESILRPRGLVLLVLLVAGCFALPLVNADRPEADPSPPQLSADDEADEKEAEGDAKPDPQPGLRDDVKLVSEEAPAYRFVIPKKRKTKELHEKWRSVDTEARVQAILADYDRRIAELEGQATPPEDQISALKKRKFETQQRFSSIRILLEVKGDPGQSVTVYTGPAGGEEFEKVIEPLRTEFKKWSGVTTHIDQEVSTKSEKKKGIRRHVIDLVGRPEGGKERRWLWVERTIRPGKGGVKHMMTYVQSRPAKERSKDEQKATLLLHSLLRWL